MELNEKQKNLKQYFTPNYLVDYLCEDFYFLYEKDDGISVLEPSCGDGAFVTKILNHKNIKELTCFELDKSLVDLILSRFNIGSDYEFEEKDGFEIYSFTYNTINSKIIDVKVYIGDFLKYDFYSKKKFDIIIGNPPYGKKDGKGITLDEAFVKKSYNLLAEDGKIIFILETKFIHGVNRFTDIWSDNLEIISLVPIVRRPMFGETSGTGKRDVSIFEMCIKYPNSHFYKKQIRWKCFSVDVARNHPRQKFLDI